MKKLLLSLIVMVFAAQLSAQSLAFKYEGETVQPGTIDIVADLNPSMEMQFDIHILNTTDADINVVAQMEDLTGIGMTYLCWGNCYMPGILEAQNTVTAGGEGVFNGHVMFVDANSGEMLPVGTEVKMAYTFFDERNPEQKYTFNVNFKYQTEEVATSALTFKYEGETVEPGTINIVSDINDSYEIQFDLDIINTTDADINVVAQMEDLTGIGMTYLCWGTCFMPGVFEATHSVAAGSEGIFNGHVMFMDANSGEVLPVGTEVKMVYTFFDERNPEQTYTFNVNFKYQPESIVDYNSADIFSNAYPNPANNTVSFDYNMPYDVNSASVAIYNMMGQEVVRQNLNLGGSRADINVSDLNEGVYFYSLIVNNQTVKTNKFVVSR
ncbi:MAG: T9SS type A sorting domain-containing protein [Bacteroidales bacterium]|nr:T9SS type A sorting domain-containing protein [Bacteroidales bacterium]